MESSSSKTGYLFFTRHGERADDKKVKEFSRIKFSGDPPLSKRGYGALKEHGEKINTYITETLGYEGKITAVTSHFIRTIQTANSICHCLANPIGYNDAEGTEHEGVILVNPSICLGHSSGNFKSNPFGKFLYDKEKPEDLIKDYCEEDSKFGYVDDESRTVDRPKYPESKTKSRYREAFLDIATQQFLNDPSFKAGDTKVVMMFSHSDCYGTFCKLFDEEYKASSPCYGATAVIKYTIDSEENELVAESLDHVIV
ncbi:unnamed protein product [Moneuplotes crassus]|uniref:Uncharacterized protein n=1 Tax=Euplotes crassus TaxID=5936 RepID=A0AAD1XRV3_EUPCR|nr:unnamed protein product [Moneuplotes crassus]